MKFINTALPIAAAVLPLISAPAFAEPSAPKLKVFFTETCGVDTITKKDSVGGAIALAIGAEVLGKVVGAGIDALGRKLTEEKVETLTATRRSDGFFLSQTSQFSYNPAIRCITIVVGRDFVPVTTEPKMVTPPDYNPLPGYKKLGDQGTAIYHNTGLVGPALFYLEGQIAFSGSPTQKAARTAFTFIPSALYYPQFITRKKALGNNDRDALVRIELSAPGETTPFGAFEWNWKDVKAGELAEADVVGKDLPWVPMPPGMNAEIANTGSVATAVYPFNAKVLITETQQPNTLAKYVGEALKGQKEEITDYATSKFNQAFSEQARITVRAAAANDVSTKYQAYVEAYDGAKSAQELYAAAAAGALKTKALALAKQAYAKLSVAQASVRIAYQGAGIGAFEALPALPALP